ncbi:P-loop containing nucleoside triphosphate hydrolase protein, partial [Piptocephalis cylindrospora]
MTPPSGILLYGPSGCGKSLMIQEMVHKLHLNALFVKGPEIFSKYLGETEATLSRIFASARASAPCVIIMDEVESLGMRRGSGGGGGVEGRVLSTLLNEMDGVGDTRGVLIIGATNAPWEMDEALLRPGRFDQKL